MGRDYTLRGSPQGPCRKPARLSSVRWPPARRTILSSWIGCFQIASWLRTGEATPNPPGNAEAVAEACAVLTEATKTPRICVTMAAAGAALWDRGNLVSAPAPKVVVKDTVGAGDAFMAGLMVGLTRGADTRTVLETACRLGAIVASHDGATPLLPQELIQEFRVKLKADSPQRRAAVLEPLPPHVQPGPSLLTWSSQRTDRHSP